MHPELFSMAFSRRVARYQLPRIRLHDLRHTWATLALSAGVDVKIVSERLGQPSADPADSGSRHGREQAPMTRVCQAEHVVRNLGGPVAGEHAQGERTRQ